VLTSGESREQKPWYRELRKYVDIQMKVRDGNDDEENPELRKSLKRKIFWISFKNPLGLLAFLIFAVFCLFVHLVFVTASFNLLCRKSSIFE
jgi:hypothetical protein